MALRSKPPVLVPREYRAELAKLSKAALKDMVWDYAMSRASASGTEPTHGAILAEYRGQVGDCSTAPRGLMRLGRMADTHNHANQVARLNRDHGRARDQRCGE